MVFIRYYEHFKGNVIFGVLSNCGTNEVDAYNVEFLMVSSEVLMK